MTKSYALQKKYRIYSVNMQLSLYAKNPSALHKIIEDKIK